MQAIAAFDEAVSTMKVKVFVCGGGGEGGDNLLIKCRFLAG